jgi:hypothetical protein
MAGVAAPLGVDGERLPDSEHDTTQDFLLVVGKAFGAPNPKAFLPSIKLLVPTTDKAQCAKEMRVQLCTDLETMPVEDATKAWPEDKSPYLTVARLVAKPQNSWSDERYGAIDTAMSFSPWHGLAAHRPLGGIMRVRREIYQRSVAFRGSRNGCPIAEPAGRLPL